MRALLALALLLALGLPPRALGQAPSRPAELPLLVRLPDEVAPEQAAAYLAALGLEALDPISSIHVWRARPLPGRPAALSTLRESLADSVVWIEQDGLAYAQEIVPNDPYYASRQWNLPLIGLEQAWRWSRGGEVVIAIIDSGIELAHPDLQARLWVNPGPGGVHGWDFVDKDAHPQDPHGHGTHVAGIVGAHTDNGIGVAGVGWNVRLMIVRVLNEEGEGSWGDLADGIEYAANNGAQILNLSLGGDGYVQTVAEAVAYARGLGCLVVAAAGNAPSSPLSTRIMFPAALEDVVAVGATTSSDEPVLSWRRGPEMDVAAPGAGVYSTLIADQGSYGHESGTSMAAPHVAGLAALLWAYKPTLTAAQVTHVITSTARDVHTPGWDERTGWGRVDAYAALSRLTMASYEHRYRFPLMFRRTGP